MTLDQLRAAVRALLDARAAEQTNYDEATARMGEIVAAAEARADSERDLTEPEAAELAECRTKADAARSALKDADDKRAEFEARITELEEVEAARSAADAAAQRYGGTDLAPVHVTGEQPVYRADGDHAFFRDAMARGVDPDAADRIARHMRQARAEKRDVGTAAFGALVVPQYLTDDFAPIARAGRPVANSVNGQPLPPDGMTLNIPRGTTGTIVASQTSENAAVAEQDYDETTLTVPVVTIAGQQDISRQALDRGTGIDAIIMQDLAGAYAAEVDRQVINGSGSNNQYLGILSTTGGVGTVTVASTAPVTQWRLLADAIQQINTNRLVPATAIYMHPRRWGFFTAATDSSGRPLVVPNAHGPNNAISVGQAAEYGQVVGDIFGLPVITSANMPTNVQSTTTASTQEDVIIVTRASDLLLYEESITPTQVRFEETAAGSLTVKIVAWGYSAFTAGRYPAATVKLTGTGMAPPTFT